MANTELSSYIIDTNTIEEEAWCRFDNQFEDEALTEGEWQAMIDRMLADASSSSERYGSDVTSFEEWLYICTLSDAIEETINNAVGEYVNMYINKYLHKED